MYIYILCVLLYKLFDKYFKKKKKINVYTTYNVNFRPFNLVSRNKFI